MQHDAYCMAEGKPLAAVVAARVAILCERGVLLEIRTRGDVRETTFIETFFFTALDESRQEIVAPASK